MIGRLAHYAVRVTDLEVSKAFYTQVLGFRTGPRPPFGFPGVWLYLGSSADRDDQGCVHLIGPGEGRSVEAYLGDRRSDGRADTGALDHIAFMADDWFSCRERLARHDVRFTERQVPTLNLRQVFLADPDGVILELNFLAES